MQDKMLELAERCKRATGPDRELDEAILRAAYVIKRGQRADLGPKFTASLDAAMSLVPQGWFLHDLTEFNQRTWQATLRGPNELRYAAGPDGWATSRTKGNPHGVATPALALCAAALRARAMKDSNHE